MWVQASSQGKGGGRGLEGARTKINRHLLDAEREKKRTPTISLATTKKEGEGG